jgi:hypothetical protein
MTVRRLLSANAGMPSLRDYLTRESHLVREPGSGFLFSNPGFRRGHRDLDEQRAKLGIAALAWSAAQPYLFVTSIFPADAGRAVLALLVLALLLVASSLFPWVKDRKTGSAS